MSDNRETLLKKRFTLYVKLRAMHLLEKWILNRWQSTCSMRWF